MTVKKKVRKRRGRKESSKNSGKNSTSKKTFKWNNGMYLKVYLLSRQGLNMTNLARSLGTSAGVLKRRMEKDQYLKEAIEEGRKFANQDNALSSFKDYVYGKLPEDLQEMWDELDDMDRDDTALERVEEMLGMAGSRSRQYLFVHAMIQNNFMVTPAARKVGASVATVKKWMEDDEFRDLLEEIKFAKKDFVEGKLMDLVEARETPAVIFANKTLNADRGYGNKMEVAHTGSVEHNHNIIDLDKVNIPVDLRVKLLECIESSNKEDDPNVILDAEFKDKIA